MSVDGIIDLGHMGNMKNMENAEGTETTDKVRKTGKLDEKLLPPDKPLRPKIRTSLI